MTAQEALRDFMRWGAHQRRFPSGQFAYWIDAYLRGDGKDQYGHRVETVEYGPAAALAGFEAREMEQQKRAWRAEGMG